MPVTAGIPKKLQNLLDDPSATRINGFYYHASSEDQKKLIWYVSANQPAYIYHGQALARMGNLPKEVKDWVKEYYFHPYYFEAAFIDGQEIQMLRFSEPVDFDGSPQPEAIIWSFYHIFEPGDLSVGDHEFNMIWYAGKDNGERRVDLNLYEAYYDWWLSETGIELEALIIRVV